MSVAIGDDAYTSTDGRSGATVTAVVSCDVALTVGLQFDLVQLDQSGPPPRHGTSTVFAPCSPGAPVEMTSDLLAGMDPGTAELAVRAYGDDDRRAVVTGMVTLDPFSAQVAELLARLADPADTTAMAELVATFTFRLAHNPIWAHEFWRAILQAGP